jgi:hypothetical protein
MLPPTRRSLAGRRDEQTASSDTPPPHGVGLVYRPFPAEERDMSKPTDEEIILIAAAAL